MVDERVGALEIESHILDLKQVGEDMGPQGRAALTSVVDLLGDAIERLRLDIQRFGLSCGGRDLSSATEGVEEILEETFRSSDTIYAVAGWMEGLAQDSQPRVAKMMSEAANQIHKACALQDVTGQHVAKVARAVGEIEHAVAALTRAFGTNPLPAAPLRREDVDLELAD